MPEEEDFISRLIVSIGVIIASRPSTREDPNMDIVRSAGPLGEPQRRKKRPPAGKAPRWKPIEISPSSN
jgi:hypothetical protein